MGKILGIDYGSKYCGMAISDEDQDIALSRAVVEIAEIETYLSKIILAENIVKIVIGLPLNLEGKETAQTLEVKKFANWLKECFPKMPISFFDERYSTQAIKRMFQQVKSNKSKDLIDMYSAVYILQGYLDRGEKNQESRIKN